MRTSCSLCNKEFHAVRVSQRYCVDCRTYKRKRVPVEQKERYLLELERLKLTSVRYKRRTRDDEGITKFVGFDGESLTVNGKHLYSLLVVGDRVLKAPHGQEITTDQALNFLYDYALEHPDQTLVGFFTDYDWTMIFKHLPESRARSLYTNEGIAKRTRKNQKHTAPHPVRWHPHGKDYEWEFDTLGGNHRRVKFRRVPVGTPYGKARTVYKWAYALDVFPFWQASFEKITSPEEWPMGKWPLSREDFEIIKRGKAQRNQFTGITPEVIEYTKAECRALAAVMRELDRGMLALGIKLRRTQWFGPGQAAQELYKLLGAPTREDFEKLPKELLKDAIASYYGGRFEQTAHGLIPGDVYEYDINSAYPDAISIAPNFAKPENWRFVKLNGGLPDSDLALVTGTSYGNKKSLVQALPHRTKKGTICFPYKTYGVYWAFEIKAGIAAGLITRFDAEYAWVFKDDGERPYAKVRDYYDLRLKLGKNSPEGKAIKLVLNSLYGKAAQSVGHPKYSSPILASFITSLCRSTILTAIGTHPKGPNACLMIATDGVYFTDEHPLLKVSPTQLGLWDKKVLRNMYFLMPGLYWEKKSEGGEKVKLKTRSVGARDWANVIPQAEAYLDKLFDIEATQEELDKINPITCPLGFSVVSPKMALHLGDWSKAGTVVKDGEKKICAISGNKSKRELSRLVKDSRGIVRSFPIDLEEKGFDIRSTPYDKDFALSLVKENERKRLSENGVLLNTFKDPIIFRELAA